VRARVQGEAVALLSAVDALTTCLPAGCKVVPGLPEEQLSLVRTPSRAAAPCTCMPRASAQA
jgi:hypothetical protein